MADYTGSDEKQRTLLLALRFPLLSMLAALRFLTIIPISWRSEEDGRFFQASLFWFPLTGLIIGGCATLPLLLSVSFFPASVSAVLAMALLAGLSGCLHLDGLADSGDGLLSGRTRERALEIMRDSRSGAMGITVLIFVLLAKYAALSALMPAMMLKAVLIMPVAGRVAILVTMASLPYGRSEGGLGQLFYSRNHYTVATIGILFFAAVSWLLVSFQAAFVLLLAMLFTVGLFSFWCFRKLGGATGDTLGAACELTELATVSGLLLYSNMV